MVLTAGDRDRLVEELFDRHYRSLRGLAYTILADGGAAEEVVMEAFTKIYSGWNRFRRVDNPPAYLRQMVANECRSRLRRAKLDTRARTQIGQAESRRPPTLDPERHAIDLDLWNVVKQLPERQRTCVVLRYLEDLPEAEIAAIMKISVGTVKSQLSHARAAMERMMGRPQTGDS